MCVAITLLSKSDRFVSGQRLFGSFERVREREKQVEVHALLHVVVPGAADKQSALPSCYGIILLSILRPTSDWPRRADRRILAAQLGERRRLIIVRPCWFSKRIHDLTPETRNLFSSCSPTLDT